MLNLDGYTKEKLTVNIVTANVVALLLLIPITIIYCIPYYIVWQDKFARDNLRTILDSLSMDGVALGMGSFLISLLAGIIAHEFIHGLTWAKYASKGFKSIKFGVMWTMLTPYCHCKEPLKVKHYIIGAVMPGIILGVLPAIAAIIAGNYSMMIFAIVFTIAAGGDFLMIFLLRKESMDSLVQDHPSEVGCFIYREREQIEKIHETATNNEKLS